MPNRPVRGFLALAVTIGSALPGLAMSPAAAEVAPLVPTGGCWTYEPAPMAPVEELSGHVDVSTALEPWTAPPVLPELRFSTGGSTTVGGVRSFAISASGGPAVTASTAETTGTASYLLDVVDASGVRTSLAPVTVPFSLAAGATAIPATSASGTVPLTTTGSSTLVLRGLVYDLPILGQRIVCNGQVEGVPGGTNPATTPLDPPVWAQYAVLPGTGMEITKVVGQRVTGAARTGDRIDLALTGFPSEATAELAVCTRVVDSTEAPTCGASLPVLTAADGSAVASIVVPEQVVTGDGFVRASVTAGALVVETSVQLLGEQSIAPHPKATARKWRLVGESWDPKKRVRLSLLDADGEQIGRRVFAKAGTRGRIRIRLEVPSRRKVVEVRAVQRSGGQLEARLDLAEAGLSGTKSGAGGNGGSNGGPSGGSNGGSSIGSSGGVSTSAPQVTTSAGAPQPVKIPSPLPLDVETVDEEPGEPGGAVEEPVARAGEIAVTKAELVGSAELVDLFGGAPSRMLRMVVENISEVEARAPGLTIAVGKGADAEPVYVSDGFGTLGPGESRVVEVPISLPIGAFGTYSISGQFGEGSTGGFILTWQTYPWGLFALNLLGVALIAWAVRRRVGAVRPELAAALAGPPHPAGTPAVEEGEAVIDLATLTRWWDLQDATRTGPMPEVLDDAVVDLAAVDRWMALRAERDLSSR